MKFKRMTVYGNPFIGVYARSNDLITIVGKSVIDSFKNVGEILDTKVIGLNIGESDILGILSVMNNHGMIVPRLTTEEEMETLKSIARENGMNLMVLEGKYTAVGNNIVANDNGCIINPKIKRMEKEIEDTLDVEVVAAKVGGYGTPGSVILATNKGFVANPCVAENMDDVELIKSILKVDGGVGTANDGVPFISICGIANKNGIVVGETTTGYELGRLLECLEG